MVLLVYGVGSGLRGLIYRASETVSCIWGVFGDVVHYVSLGLDSV